MDQWMPEIKSELESIAKNNTWDLVPIEGDVNLLTGKFIFQDKPSGPKSHYVARGFQQVYGVDYSDTYDPVVKFTVIRVLCAFVTHQNLEFNQMGVSVPSETANWKKKYKGNNGKDLGTKSFQIVFANYLSRCMD